VISSEDNYIQLIYPDELISQYGYAIYAYKEGYVPLEIFSTWEGEGTATDNGEERIIRPMYKIENCKAEILKMDTRYNSGTLTVSSEVSSPVKSSGIISYVPPELNDFYSSPVKVNIEIKEGNLVVFESSESFEIPFSESREVVFTDDLKEGDYDIRVFTTLEDPGFCHSYEPDEEIRSLSVEEEERRVFRPIYTNNEDERSDQTVFTSESEVLSDEPIDLNGVEEIGEKETSFSFLTLLVILLFIANAVLIIILYFIRN
jgi:hypothetical protein